MSILPSLTLTAVPAEPDTGSVLQEKNDGITKPTFHFDFTKNEFVSDSMGRPVITSDPELVLRGLVDKTLHDARYKHLIYDNSYGNEVEGVIAQDYAFDIFVSELKRVYREALIYHPLIKDVKDFAFTAGEGCVYCDFCVESVSGVRIQRKEVVTK